MATLSDPIFAALGLQQTDADRGRYQHAGALGGGATGSAQAAAYGAQAAAYGAALPSSAAAWALYAQETAARAAAAAAAAQAGYSSPLRLPGVLPAAQHEALGYAPRPPQHLVPPTLSHAEAYSSAAEQAQQAQQAHLAWIAQAAAFAATYQHAAASAATYQQAAASAATYQQAVAAAAAAAAAAPGPRLSTQPFPPPSPIAARSPLEATPARRPQGGLSPSEKGRFELSLADRTPCPKLAKQKTPLGSSATPQAVPLNLTMATPPPKSSSSFRADAPAFVPGGSAIDAGLGLEAKFAAAAGPPSEVFETPIKEIERDSFVRMRTQMLRMRFSVERERGGRAASPAAVKYGTAVISVAAPRRERVQADADSHEIAGIPASPKKASVFPAGDSTVGALLLHLVKGDDIQEPQKEFWPEAVGAPKSYSGAIGEKAHGASPHVAEEDPTSSSAGEGTGGKGHSRGRIRAAAAAARAASDGGLSSPEASRGDDESGDSDEINRRRRGITPIALADQRFQ